MKNFQLILKIIISVILLQTLYFKFTGAAESVFIFTTIGAEPSGRIGSGVVELIACLLFLSRKLDVYGAVLSLMTMTGAIFSHLTILGIVVNNDSGLLFSLACIVWLASLTFIILNLHKFPKSLQKG